MYDPFTAPRKEFKVWRKSENTNSFGMYEYFLTAKDGEGWKVSRTLCFPWEVGQIVRVPIRPNDKPDWAFLSCELTEQLIPYAPPKVIKEIWAIPTPEVSPK